MKNQHEAVEISPSEYLYHLSFGDDRLTSNPEERILVKGDVVIDGLEFSGRLPKATILGNCTILKCKLLRSCFFDCSGTLSICDCNKLIQIGGRTSGLTVKRCGIEALGADFECDGDILLEGCPMFSKINCRVGGDFSVLGEGTIHAGPAFSCEGALSLFDGAGFVSWHKQLAVCGDAHANFSRPMPVGKAPPDSSRKSDYSIARRSGL